MTRTYKTVRYSPKGKEHPLTPTSAARGVEDALKVLEGRWKLVILFHLFGGKVLRFSELERAIPAISQKMLIQQLRQMEADGIVRRIVHHQVPPKVEYCLTKWGQASCPALDALMKRAALREKMSGSDDGPRGFAWRHSMLRSITFVLLLVLLPSCAAPLSTMPSPPDDLTAKLGKSVSNYNLGVFNFVGALIRVSNDFEIPIGIAWVNSPAAHTELPFAWKKTTVLDIIQNIANTQPGYQVDVRDGVVHIWPSGLVPDRENFLKLRIPAFDVHDAYVEVASFKLHMLVAPREYGQISIGATGDSKVSLELKNTSVEAALDALVIASNRKIWVVTFSDDAKLTVRGLRRAESLWSGKATPDEEQPSWDLIRWGDPLPPLAVGNQVSHLHVRETGVSGAGKN